MPRGKRGRRYLPDLSISVEEWERIRDREQGREATASTRRDGQDAGPGPRAGRRVAGNGQDRGHRPRPRPLSDQEREQVRQRSLTGLVRPHRKPWQPPELDLADLPCICTAKAACALHRRELGRPRPYARA